MGEGDLNLDSPRKEDHAMPLSGKACGFSLIDIHKFANFSFRFGPILVYMLSK